MIPGAREIAHALFGAWRLARLDPTGLQHFRTDETGFWRSFFAAVLVAPGHAILVALDTMARAGDGEVDWTRIAIVQAIAFIAAWAAFPLAMQSVAAALGRSQTYIRYIVAYNWSAVLQVALHLMAAALRASFPGATGDAVTLFAFVAVMAYAWYIARVALDVKPLAATGVVAFDIAIGLVIAGIIGRLGG